MSMVGIGGFAQGLSQGFMTSYKMVSDIKDREEQQKLAEAKAKQEHETKTAKLQQDAFKLQQDQANADKELALKKQKELTDATESAEKATNVNSYNNIMSTVGGSKLGSYKDKNGKEYYIDKEVVPKIAKLRDKYEFADNGELVELDVNGNKVPTGIIGRTFGGDTDALGKGGDYASINGVKGYYSRAQLAQATSEGKEVVELATQSNGSSRKPTSYEEIDRWYNEAKTLKNKENRTKGDNERLRFLDNQLLKNVAGKKDVADNISSTELT